MKAGYLLAGAVVLAIAAGGAYYFLQEKPARPVPPPVSTQKPPPAPTAPPAAPAPPPAPTTCLLPGPPPVPPNGAIASDADMKLGHDVIQGFVLRLEAYQSCQLNLADRAPPSVTPERKQILIEQGNAAVDEAHALADAFSAQLKIYRAKHP